MALDYGILESKKNMDYKLGKSQVRALDLLSKCIDDTIDFSSGYSIIKVTKDYIARPDLISYVLYQSDEYADLLCKINGISNPFELNDGMILVCPSLNFIDRLVKLSSENESLDGFADDNSNLLNKYKSYKKKKNEKRSPNESTVSEHNYIEIPGTNLLIY